MPGARLSEQERFRIEAMWRVGESIPQIAEALGRDRSTVWREIKRNNSYRHGVKHPGRRTTRHLTGRGGVYRWGYDAGWAHEKARSQARRPRPARLVVDVALRAAVVKGLKARHSPRQISNRLRLDHPGQARWQVSHETIYQAIYVQSRGNLRAELADQVALRSGRTRRRARPVPGAAVRSARAWITPQFHISARPPEAEDRAVPGHWEGDLVIGARGSSAIVTLVERSTRYVMLGSLPTSRVSEQVIDVLSTLAGRLPAHLLRSLAWDCGSELARHAQFTVATDCPVFFCDPHSPWQRGTNENTNGLLRQYYPRASTDFRAVTQTDLDHVAAELNGRPRMTLNWHTPSEALNQLLVATTT